MSNLERTYTAVLRWLVYVLVVVSGLAIFVMIGTICADVVLRRFGHPVVGAYDIVKIAGAITLACALPYTTAVKGHVAIEYFFHKLNRTGRVIVDTFVRLLGIVLFGFLGWRSFLYGGEMRDSGQVTQTLQLPIFWLPWVIGVCCVVVMLVIGYNLLHPNKEMIKP
jgi:TRAP-type C4-dicarboxylate transport system permease small subunit